MTAGDVIVVKGSTHAKQAVMFDGVDDELQINASSAGLQGVASTEGTISFWFMPDNITGTYGLYSAGAAAGAADTNLLIQQAAGKIRIYGRIQATAGFDIITTNTVLTKGKWHHICIVQNGTRPIIYIDGAAVAMTDTVDTDLTVWWSVLVDLDEGRLGCRTIDGGEDQFLLGTLGPFKIWNTALSATEVDRENHGLDTSAETARQAIIAAALYNHWAWDEVLTDAGTGADTATVVAEAYLCGWASEWSRLVEVHAVVADDLQTILYPGGAMTLILKAA